VQKGSEQIPAFASLCELHRVVSPKTQLHKLCIPIGLLQEPLIIMILLYLHLIVWEGRSSTAIKDRTALLPHQGLISVTFFTIPRIMVFYPTKADFLEPKY